MTPTMSYFEQALFAPEQHFKRLRQMEPLRCRERAVTHTHNAMESEILWEGRHYLIFLPFKREALCHIEELEATSRERTIGPLIPHRILYNEFIEIDSLGNKRFHDIILQEIPDGMILDKAVDYFKASDLREAIRKMKARLDAIGFCHNNLRPHNIVICKSGIARPLRYWYSEWETFSDNNISVPLEFIDSHDYYLEDDKRSSLILNDDSACYSAPPSYIGITRQCRGGRYGFVDEDGRAITRFIYSWASDFCEDRAVVAKCGKMGAINSLGRKVLAAQYEHVEFDVQRGIFKVRNRGHDYFYDYNGDKINNAKKSLEKIEGGG